MPAVLLAVCLARAATPILRSAPPEPEPGAESSVAPAAATPPGPVPVTVAPAAAAPSPALPDADAFRAINNQVGRVFASSRDAVVRIHGLDAFGPHSGTGFFVDPNGTILTHYSVGGDSTDLIVEFGDKKYPASCLLADPRSGVALLKIEAATPFLPVGRSDALEVFTPVVAVGYPMDLPCSPHFGLVSGFDQKILDGYLIPAHVRVEVPVRPGEQGAPLLNLRGEAVGIVVGRFGEPAACYVLPIKAAEKVRRDFVRFGGLRPGIVGVTITPAPGQVDDPQTKTQVAELAPGSPAALSGLKSGDTLLQIGETPIRKPSDVLDAAFYLTGGDDVPIVVQRDGETRVVHVLVADQFTFPAGPLPTGADPEMAPAAVAAPLPESARANVTRGDDDDEVPPDP